MKFGPNPVEVCLGPGKVDDLPLIVRDLGAQGGPFVMVTTEGTVIRGDLARVQALLAPATVVVFSDVRPNPTVADSQKAYRDLMISDLLWKSKPWIIALGGGSVLDLSKALAAQFHFGDRVREAHVWLAGHLRDTEPFPPEFSPARMIAIPTTAGTGSEVTMWATIWDEKSKKKHSLSHRELYPQVAIVDPELTLSVPEETTLATALDALSHAMESLWNKNRTAFSEEFALKAVSLVFANLVALLHDPSNLKLRETIQLAALYGGLAMSVTKTALAHSISYPLTARLGLPHGLACSLTLPEVLRANAVVEPALLEKLARAMGCESTDGVVDDFYAFFDRVGLPQVLRKYFGDSFQCDDIKDAFITPDRAANSLVVLDEVGARALLTDAVNKLLA